MIKTGMTTSEILNQTGKLFLENGIESPRLDAEVLLAEVLKIDRLSLYVKWDVPVNESELERFQQLVEKRLEGCPVAYLRGRKEFMSLDFEVNPSVPIPRPETEFIVEHVLKITGENESFRIADICTGSGNIAVSIAFYRPGAEVYATDISTEALATARRNAAKAGVSDRVTFCEGSLLEPLGVKGLSGSLDIIVSNPPYIPSSVFGSLPDGIRKYEPRRAFVSGSKGLDHLSVLADRCGIYLRQGGFIAFEIGFDQADQAAELIKNTGCFENIKFTRDYLGHDRIITAEKI